MGVVGKHGRAEGVVPLSQAPEPATAPPEPTRARGHANHCRGYLLTSRLAVDIRTTQAALTCPTYAA